MDDWSVQFKSLLSSPLGEEMKRELQKLHDSIVDEAQKATSQENAFGLLKQARGVIRCVEHLHTIAAFAPTDEGSKVK